MTTKTASKLEHAKFCLPRPGHDEPRIEAYLAPRYMSDGTLDRHIAVERCTECGRATYDGVPEDELA